MFFCKINLIPTQSHQVAESLWFRKKFIVNKKVFWSLAISPVVILPAFVIASCSDNFITGEPKSEAARLQFLDFKRRVYEERFNHKTAEAFEEAIKNQNRYNEQKKFGLESVAVRLENGFFIIDFRIKLFSGSLEEFNAFSNSNEPAKDSDPREIVQNTFRIDTNATNINTP